MKQSSPESNGAPTVSVACPQCGSTEIKRPDHADAALGYWRCLTCGVVWNPERPPSIDAPRSGNSPKWGRGEKQTDYWKDRFPR
jgi:predicted RNA-binding Zn-ribbon protein involved in translation (DUF1610 family)